MFIRYNMQSQKECVHIVNIKECPPPPNDKLCRCCWKNMDIEVRGDVIKDTIRTFITAYPPDCDVFKVFCFFKKQFENSQLFDYERPQKLAEFWMRIFVKSRMKKKNYSFVDENGKKIVIFNTINNTSNRDGGSGGRGSD